MAVRILLPTALQRYAGGREEVRVEAATVGDALHSHVNREDTVSPETPKDQGPAASASAYPYLTPWGWAGIGAT